MRNIIEYRVGTPSWVRWIRKRIKNNLNFLALAQGSVGIGKSWAMINVAYMIDKTFEPRQIAFSFKEVMNILHADWFNRKEWKIMVFDEAQCDISNRTWQSLTNKLMNYLLSTFRHRNVILLFTSPYSDFLDSQTMKLVHCIFEIKSHSKRSQKTMIRPKLLQYNSQRKKFYYHSLYVIRDGKYQKLVNWMIGKPPQHLIIPYEKSKVEFTDRLNREIRDELEGMETQKVIKRHRKPLTELQHQILDLREKGMTLQKDIALKLGKDDSEISRNIQRMRNKGYAMEK